MTRSKSFLQNLIRPFTSNSTRDQNEVDLEKIAAQEQKQFSFHVLVSATKNFTQKLGEGGFGPVFKGKLDDGREIAVKKLSHSSSQGNKEFQNEAKLLARVQHRNVVNLLGYCVHGVEKLLVYEYVVNESLDKILFKSNKREVLDWKRRHDIIAGIAKGLLYLHEEAHCRIIHRDIKASNILLDDKWVPKIADFGMARLFAENQTHVNTRVAGTNGYMAPEYLMHGNLSEKADVFSFGVVVLELISGQKNSSFNRDPDSQNLLEWAYKLYKNQQSLEIMDPILASPHDPDQMKICIHLGLLCVQSDPKLRPDMKRIVIILSRTPSILVEPTRPGYPGTRYRRSHHKPTASSSATGTSGLSNWSHHKPTASSSTTGTSGLSNSKSSGYTTNLQTGTLTVTTSGIISPGLDPRGKRPVHDH